MNKLRVFEAFAGVGSQSMALRNLGIDYEVVGISEIDVDALISYSAIKDSAKLNMDITKSIEEMREELIAKNVGYDFKKQKSSIPRMREEKLKKVYLSDMISNNFGDISLINVDLIPEHDLFTYSFPCQDIPTAGKQEGLVKNKTRSGLLYECEKIIEHCKPKYLLMENVKNLVGKKFKSDFDKWLEYLENLGYTNYWKVLNAKDFVPQNRERVFVVSILDNKEQYAFPEAKELDITLEDILEEQVEEKYFLSDKANKKIARHGNKIVNNDNPKVSCCIHAGYCRMGGRDQQYVKTPYSFPKCSTLDTMQGENAPLRIRKLTPLECWRLMGFTDEDFYKAKNAGVSNTQLYRQAGNSIVVNVLEGIFKNLFL